MTLDIISLFLGVTMTLVIFSYLLGDNILYRWALAILVGGGVGYALGVTLRLFLFSWIAQLLTAPNPTPYVVPLVLGGLLLLKWFPPSSFLGKLSSWFTNIPMAYLIGVGAGVTVSGALLGTLLPQVRATGASLTLTNVPWGPLQGVVVIIGTVAALTYFSPRLNQNEGRRRPVVSQLQRFGRFFIVIALAVAFAGVITSGLTVWTERIWGLLEQIRDVAGGVS